MTLEEALKGVMTNLDTRGEAYLFVAKTRDGAWCCGFTDEVILPMDIRDRISADQNSKMDGYITLDSLYKDELRALGPKDFARNYQTSIELAMKSRITFHKKPT